jgi:hypothetical protein
MRNRVLTCLLLAAITPLSYAKDKKKSTLPALVLNAKTVAVIINPGSETPLSGPGENVSAQSDVERALTKWGRLHVVLSPSNADLVISIRKGRSVSPTVAGGDPNRRPVIFDPASADTRIGIQTGTPPRTGSSYPDDPTPRPGMEVGPSEDLFEVYDGRLRDPLDGPPLWRYMGKNALRPPSVNAVEQFRKAVEEAEKQQKQKTP